MSQTRLIAVLLSPSWLSFSVCAAITLVAISIVNWSYFTYNQVFFDFFYGKQGVITTIEQVPGAFEIPAFTDIPIVYGAIVVGLAVGAATVVFFVVRGAESGVGAVTHVGQGVDRREYVQHGLMRLLVGALWLGYGFLSLHMLLPAALLFSRIGAEDVTTAVGLATGIGGTVLLWLVLHVHVIFARLLRLRPRVFGGESAIEDAMITKS